jgi:hypothetical protein
MGPSLDTPTFQTFPSESSRSFGRSRENDAIDKTFGPREVFQRGECNFVHGGEHRAADCDRAAAASSLLARAFTAASGALRQPWGHSASRAGPSYRLPGRPTAVFDQPPDDVEIRHRQQIGLAIGKPLGARQALALRAVPVTAAIVSDANRAAVNALLDMAAEALRSGTPRWQP